MERETGIEPASLAWKARVLPLNYSRISDPQAAFAKPPILGRPCVSHSQIGGGGWIRTSVGVSQQIYSLPPLATRAPLRTISHYSLKIQANTTRGLINSIYCTRLLRATRINPPQNTGAAGGDRTHDPWLRRPILYPLSYSRTPRVSADFDYCTSAGHPQPEDPAFATQFVPPRAATPLNPPVATSQVPADTHPC